VDFIASPGTLEKRKVSYPCQESKHNSSDVWPMNWAILVVNSTIFIVDIITAVVIII
jgi:hypothetical protein